MSRDNTDDVTDDVKGIIFFVCYDSHLNWSTVYVRDTHSYNISRESEVIWLRLFYIIIIIKVLINPFLQMSESGTIVLLFTCVCDRK